MANKMLKRKFVDTSVYDKAVERINHAFDLFDHICVSFSGGKDSTVCLNLALEVARERGRLPLRAYFFDEEAIPYQTEEYVRRMDENSDIDIEWYCLPFKCANACNKKDRSWYPWAPEDKKLWVRPLPPEAIIEVPGLDLSDRKTRCSFPEANNILSPAKRWGTVGTIMGIRTQESLTRYRAVVRKVTDNYIIGVSAGSSWGSAANVQGNAYKVYPIYDWSTQDVWTAPKKFGWDYNRGYDVMEMAGITAHAQRMCPAFGEEPIQRLWTYSACFPEIWDKMLERVPGAAAAFRYSRTELYAFGALPAKPPSLSWEEFIGQNLAKFNRKDRAFVAQRIQDEMTAHYKKTNDPILDRVSHYITGVSWSYLLMLSVRGDFKKRKQAYYSIDTNNLEALKAKYIEAYEAEKGRRYKG